MPMEIDRDPIAGPGDRVDLVGTGLQRVDEELLVQRPADPAPPVVWARRDHVRVRDLGMVGADEPDEEPDEPAAIVLGDPRRPAEVAEPEARQQGSHLAAAPPFVDKVDHLRMVRFGRPTELKVAHRAASHAAATPTTNWSGTSNPNVSAR